MGRKRKAAGRSSAQSGPKDVDPADARLGPINTFEDIADSEDEFWMKRDVIEFDDEPSTKRRKRWEQEEKALEESEEEILDYDDDDDDGDEELELERLQAKLKTKSKKGRTLDSDEEASGDDDEDEDEGWRGANRDEYYNADNIETEDAALEEEAEALRLQQKKLAKMSEADFIFDQDEWAAAAVEDDDKDKLATEVLKDVEISENLSAEERYQIFQRRYPEFDYLVNEFEQLQPLLAGLQKDAEGKPAKSLEVLKYWILGCYVAALASYFAILTSPARDDNGAERTLEPDELRDHDVMETLVNCRKQWVRVRNLRSLAKSTEAADGSPVPEELPPQSPQSAAGETVPVADGKPVRKLSRKERAQLAKREALALEKAAAKAKRDAAVEASLADLSSLLNKTKTKPKKSTKKVPATSSPASDIDSLSDFGEETTLSSRAAVEKAARKKSLRFYTSQITQKASKRSTTSRDAGGDIDIPYRERLRDRQARLSAAAAKRGSAAGPGAELGEDSGSEYDEADRAAARAVRDGHGSDDEYYDMVAASSKQKKDERVAKYAALAAASTADLVVPQETVGEDGKRKITYAIQKNKGLTPHRKKENRNPRVKKRRAFAEKQKKWKTMRPTYSGGEGKGGYQGELTGIKKGLVKVTRL